METIYKTKKFRSLNIIEEQNFLENQHKKGWKLIEKSLNKNIYTFEETSSADYVYEFFYLKKEEIKDFESYLKLFIDNQWESITILSNNNEEYHEYYFRKLRNQVLFDQEYLTSYSLKTKLIDIHYNDTTTKYFLGGCGTLLFIFFTEFSEKLFAQNFLIIVIALFLLFLQRSFQHKNIIKMFTQTTLSSPLSIKKILKL